MKPKVLRASKKLCVRGGCLSLMNAAGGADASASGFANAVGALKARLAFAAEVAVAGEAAADVAPAFEDGPASEPAVVESDVEAEAVAGAERGPRSSVADADGPKNANNANNMAHAMADLTRAPPLARRHRSLANGQGLP
ncbi:MAG TPA: hypothetical protein VGH51_07505 [Candidatus Angelobacter sp.]|jgi:hypothetical protein